MLRHRERPFQRENKEQWQMAEIQIIMKGGETLDGYVFPSHMSGMKTILFVFWGT